MVQVIKKENESTGSLLRRFTRAVKLSSFLTRARGRRYYVPQKSEYQEKKDALRRVELQKEMDKMRKLGKIN